VSSWEGKIVARRPSGRHGRNTVRPKCGEAIGLLGPLIRKRRGVFIIGKKKMKGLQIKDGGVGAPTPNWGGSKPERLCGTRRKVGKKEVPCSKKKR